MNTSETSYESGKLPLNIFTEYETMELLKLIEDPEIQKLFATYRKKHKYVWSLISNILAEKGINKTEDKCANRFENMKAKFFRIEKRRMQGHNEDTDWPYYEFFQRFVSNNYMSNDMQYVHQSMVSAIPPIQSYNMHKVKIEPNNVLSLMETTFHDHSEINKINNQNNQMHPTYGFNTNGIPDIQSNQETKLNYQQIHEPNQESQREQEHQQPGNCQEEITNNTENTNDEEKQHILISPHYVHHVERIISENHFENSNESGSNHPIPSSANNSTSNNTNGNNINKNSNETYSNVPPVITQPPTRKIPTRIPPNVNHNTNVINPHFNAKIARKFKKIKIDEELLAIRKEKYALELEILRFQLENEKKINEKHSLELKILEEKLKHELLENQKIEKSLKLNEIIPTTMQH